MKQLTKYILETFGVTVCPEPIGKQQTKGLPMYIGETYILYNLVII